jgi:hypothetical protein
MMSTETISDDLVRRIVDENDIHHVTICDDDCDNGGYACCNTAICGADVTNEAWKALTTEIPCPICYGEE